MQNERPADVSQIPEQQNRQLTGDCGTTAHAATGLVVGAGVTRFFERGPLHTIINRPIPVL